MATQFFLWRDEYSVNIEELDNHHKRLIELINELYDAFMKKELEQKIGSIINELEKYTQFHFAAEERYFKAYLYPDMNKHIEEHKAFINKISEFKQQAGSTVLSFQLTNFLRDWLNNHILYSDKKYSSYLNSKGVR